MADPVCIGTIVGARGIKGDVKVKAFTDTPADVAAYGPVTTDEGQTLTLKVTGDGKGVVIVRMAGVTDRNGAEALKGQRLYVDRSALPETDDEDEYYHADLIGLRVVDETETECGTVTALYDFGAGDVVEIRRPSGATVMLPFTTAAVPKVDVTAGHVVVSAAMLADAEASPLQPEDGEDQE